jgi:predicted kinase
MARKINLPTCRATPAEHKRLLELCEVHGYEKIAHFWRRCLTQLIKQNEGKHRTEIPLRFIERRRPSNDELGTEPEKPVLLAVKQQKQQRRSK